MTKRTCCIRIALVLAALTLTPLPVLRADNPPCPADTDRFIWVATAESIFGKLERLSARICGTSH